MLDPRDIAAYNKRRHQELSNEMARKMLAERLRQQQPKVKRPHPEKRSTAA